MKQPAFAGLIKSNKSNIKTWETTETLPTDILIYSRLAALAGVTVNDLKNKKLTEKDITLNVEKVEDQGNINQQEYINELREDKKRAAIREDRIMGQLASNLTAMMQLLTALSGHDRAFHDTMLRSLARLEGKKEIDLIGEARSSEAAKQVERMTGSSNDDNRM